MRYGIVWCVFLLLCGISKAQFLPDSTITVEKNAEYSIPVPEKIQKDTNPQIQIEPIDSAAIRLMSQNFVRRKINEFLTTIAKDKIVEYVSQQDILNERISNYYLPFENKIIGNIYYKTFDFDVDFSDTSKKIDFFGTKILSALHTTSRNYVIKNSMFIKKGTPLNPFVIADNERYLRTLHFIRDARIVVMPDSLNDNFVDVYVITKDLFSLFAELHNFSAREQHLTISESNLFGTGQSLSITGLRDINRDPKMGGNIRYFIPNLWGSFVNAELNAGNISRNYNDWRYNVMDFSLQLQRPLYSQYANFIGDLIIGKQKTFDTYAYYYNDPNERNKYVNYEQNYIDLSLGYNIDAEKYIRDNKVPDRNVVMLRFLNHHFVEFPEEYLYRFSDSLSNRTAILFQYTYFKQYFYKTNYILGFGTTEDMPAGINVSITAGYKKINDITRPYLGFDLNRYTFTNESGIIGYFLRAGTYYAKGIGIEDLNFLGGISLYSKLVNIRNSKFRQKVETSYAQQVNPFTSEPLKINNLFGLNAFREDSIMGDKRLSLRSESIFFLHKKLLGFNFAPFVTADATLLDLNKHTIWQDRFYYSIGGGLRTRNENLQFGTIELRFNYFPKKIYRENQFKIMLRTNLRFRYNSSYVTKPRFVEYNSDIYNNVY